MFCSALQARRTRRDNFLWVGFSLSWPGEIVKTKKDTNARKQNKAAGQRNKQKKAREAIVRG